MAYIHEAHLSLIAALTKLRPADLSMYPSASEFDARREYAEAVAAAMDSYFHSLAVDTAFNGARMKSEAYVSLVSDALTDSCFLSDLTDAAEAEREDRAEFNADRKGWAKANVREVA